MKGALDTAESPPGRSLDRIEDFGTVLLKMDKRQQQHGEMLIEILKLLRPSDDKPGAGDLVKELISRIDRQTAMLRILIATIAQLGQDLPATVVELLHTNPNGAGGDFIPDATRHPKSSNGKSAP